MEQRVSIITLGVADLQRSREFYDRLGWRRSMTKRRMRILLPTARASKECRSHTTPAIGQKSTPSSKMPNPPAQDC
jgi:hypothetical protein